ncbi:glycosyltransferase family 2 protein [Candidatus Roizmanbacteria bacterium]|nr:glycosyltransferase family 2 protein [Candidatus Roizmanbacteria bacterium]
MIDLSIIILSYNTSEITRKCIESLLQNLTDASLQTELIVIDNHSSDNSPYVIEEFRKTKWKNVVYRSMLLQNNLGYTRANNKGIEGSHGRYTLFLNSDVLINTVDFNELVTFMDTSPKIGGLTVRVNLEDGGIDPASHRGLPTPWRSFCYFSGLERLFGHFPYGNRLFGGYHLLYHNLRVAHEIDAPSGAFFMVRKNILDILKGFDERFFMYGEDIDLAYRMRQLGYTIYYYPKFTVTHLKYQSGLGNKNQKLRKKIRIHFYESMKIFYQKHYEARYPWLINQLVYLFITLKQRIS